MGLLAGRAPGVRAPQAASPPEGHRHKAQGGAPEAARGAGSSTVCRRPKDSSAGPRGVAWPGLATQTRLGGASASQRRSAPLHSCRPMLHVGKVWSLRNQCRRRMPACESWTQRSPRAPRRSATPLPHPLQGPSLVSTRSPGAGWHEGGGAPGSTLRRRAGTPPSHAPAATMGARAVRRSRAHRNPPSL
eukprot:2597565-Prymnesium_polylepis.1